MAKYFIFFLCYIIPLTISTKSFTLVVDTTWSMREEIDIIKSNMDIAINGVRDKDVEYILLPFGDPVVGPSITASSANDLLSLLDLVEVSGGHNCPEKSLSALEMALRQSKPNAYIFLFTDAKAEDTDKYNSIQTLCHEQQSKVFIFISDKCETTDSIDIFHDVAKSCSGAAFYFELPSLRKAFTYMKERLRTDWIEIGNREELYGHKRFTVAVDAYALGILIELSGEHPDIQIINNFEESPAFEQIMNTRHAKVIRILEPASGNYSVKVQCQGYGVVTVFTHRELQFKYGFSPKVPRSLIETSSRPIPGTTCNVLIILPDPSVELKLVEVHIIKTNERKALTFDVVDINKGLYIAKHLFEPGKSFKLSVNGFLKTNYQSINGQTKSLEPQQLEMVTEWFKPEVEIIDTDSNLVDFGLNVTFACKVDGFPRPDVWWEDDQGEIIPSETSLLEMPSTYISYMRIHNATRNGTISCKAKNAINESDNTMEVFVNRTFTFEVLQYPSDITVEYGEEGRLFCQIDAYPEAEIKWYHNGTEVDSNDEVELVPDEHLLIIKEMDLHNAGEYVCEVKNEVEFRKYPATVYITGLDAPEVQIKDAEIVLKPGDWTEQECTVLKGKPAPVITWKYKVENDYDDLDIPEGVYIEGNKIKIPSAQSHHAGVFTCEATNIMGVDSQEVIVRVQYPPKIKNKDESLSVKQGDLVTLSCDVDAVPNAEVHWDMYQDDVIITFDDGHYTDDRYTHRFIAKSNDSGMYHCIAKNSMGKATRTVNVNVWVAPYIEPPVSKNITQKSGSNVYLGCYISLGNPMPATRWEFIAPNTNTNTSITVLAVGNSTGDLKYDLKNINRRNEGIYRCIAENEVGVDTIHIYLKVV